MSSTEITQQQNGPVHFPGQSLPGGDAMNVGAVAIEQQRAVAEAQGKMVLAKRFPRSESAAYAKLMEACKLPALASVAFYTVPRAGGSVSGPSIRLAEEIARVYGNMEYGHRELSRDDKKSEVQVFAWDVENNNLASRQLTVMHVRDTKNGPQKLRDQKDIDDKIANVASKQLRGRILALMPKYMVEAAIQECRKTLEGNNDIPIAERVRKMTQAFAKYGVSEKHLSVFLGHSLDTVTSEEIADLQGVFNAIRDGQSISDYFSEAESQEANTATGAALAQAASEGAQQRTAAAPKGGKPGGKGAKQEKAQPQPDPTPETQPEPVADAAQQQASNSVESNSNAVEDETPEDPANSASADAGEPPADQAQAHPAAGSDDIF